MLEGLVPILKSYNEPLNIFKGLWSIAPPILSDQPLKVVNLGKDNISMSIFRFTFTMIEFEMKVISISLG